jgi:hypothetical protein
VTPESRFRFDWKGPAPRAAEPRAHYGLRPFPKRGGIVTNELIDRLREDDAY